MGDKLEKDLIIFGNGGLASLVRVYCETEGIRVAGFVIDSGYRNAEHFDGLPNIDFQCAPDEFPPSNYQLFIAIGATDMLGFSRKEKMQIGRSMGYELFSFNFAQPNRSPNITIGKNTLIMPGSSVDPFVVFGAGIIAWNGSTICHHSTIGDYSFIAPGATICGKVIIQEHCFIGSNATIRDNIFLAAQTLVGAGAVITKSTEPGGVYMPARTVQISRQSDQIQFNQQ